MEREQLLAMLEERRFKVLIDDMVVAEKMDLTTATILTKALFKSNGDNFTNEELLSFPIGVVNAIASKIMELSGVDVSQQNQLKDF